MYKVACGALFLCATAAFSLGLPAVGRSQIASPSQVTPQNLRPDESFRNSSISLTQQAALTAPSGTENLNVLIADVQIDGGFAEFAVQTAALTQEINGKRVSVAQIYALARAIEKLYAAAGYALARVTVPPQQLIDRGKLVIVIVDGFIEEISLAGVPERVRAEIAGRVSAIVGRRQLKLAEIERCLLIAGDIPGLKLRSTLARGTQNGGTRLVLDGEHRLVTGSLDTDNRLPVSLGTWQLRGAVALNSAFEYGEQLYVTAGVGADLNAAFQGASPLTVYGGGAIVPLGATGITINPEYTHSTTRTAASPGVPFSIGVFERFAIRVRDPVIWMRNSLVSVNASLEYISQQVRAPIFNANINDDAYAVIRGGPDYAVKLPWGTGVQIGASISQGIGGRTELEAVASGVPLSRAGAGPDFTKINGSGRLSQPLPADLRFDVIGSGQFSLGKPMLRSEQFSLDGPDAVSAFASGSFNVDQGATVRGELVRPFALTFVKSAGTVAPYVFGSAGRGQLFEITNVEQSVIEAAALGLGVRGSVDPTSMSPAVRLGLEMARQFTDVPGFRPGWRANVNLAVAF